MLGGLERESLDAENDFGRSEVVSGKRDGLECRYQH